MPCQKINAAIKNITVVGCLYRGWPLAQYCVPSINFVCGTKKYRPQAFKQTQTLFLLVYLDIRFCWVYRQLHRQVVFVVYRNSLGQIVQK